MVTTAISEARRRNPNCEIGIVCVSQSLPKIVEEIGAIAVPIWLGVSCGPFLDALEHYDAVAVIGADVMDGHFSVSDAFRAWSFADLAARRGRRSMVVGFSFSLTPDAELAEILCDLSPDLHIYAREQLSWERFNRSSTVRSTLVSDSAFLLPAAGSGPDQDAAEAWVGRQRAAGRFVCAINTHPMLFPGNDVTMMSCLIDVLSDVLDALSKRYAVAFMLIPHDFRSDGRGDNAALGPLNQRLNAILGDRVFHAQSSCRAAEIKGLVALCDLLVTGRMHLGVGALSMGVPMWAINPQDKFVGLFQHFGLTDLRLQPSEALVRIRLEAFLESAMTSWPDIRDQVRLALPGVLQRARKNFAPLD